MSLHYNGANSYLFVNGKKIYKFKANNRDANFSIQLCPGSMSNEFNILMILKKYLLKEMCMVFQSITMLLINLKY